VGYGSYRVDPARPCRSWPLATAAGGGAARNVAPVVIVFALLAALCNAVSVTTRHVASVADPHKSAGWRLIIYLLRNPVWLIGWAAQAAAFVFQALALHNGEVSVVQPLLVIELVLTLVLRRVWIRQSIRPAAWSGGGLACLGLAVFLVASEPQGGNEAPTSGHWAAAIIGCAALIAVLMALGRLTPAGPRAALWGAAAATAWALIAAFIKSTTDTITQFGVGGMFTHWPVYALAVGGLTGVLLEQWALQAGPLRVSQPFLVIVDPLVSIVLSVWLFGEHFVPDAGTVAISAVAFAVMCAGVVVLTQTAPATMEPAAPPAEPAH
jgi:drug/metabolite transporter (DMT)-like permease